MARGSSSRRNVSLPPALINRAGGSEGKDGMGVFDAQPQKNAAHTIEIHRESWRDGEVVTARVRVTSEDEQWVTAQLLQRMLNVRKGLSTSDQFALVDRLWLERLIVSWTLTRNGQIIPLSAKSIVALPREERDFLVQRIFQKQPERPLRINLSRLRTQQDFRGAFQARKQRFQQIEK